METNTIHGVIHNLTLTSIQRSLNNNEEEIVDAKITALINNGYSFNKAATEFNFSQNKIRLTFNPLGLEGKTVFRYVGAKNI
ncbi:hypothetical protein [Lactobacillus sp. wkB10]|uniref:hypothetical protein n=1 Tax=Lactobacillus sp. wkB10 TaxID=1545701 RepID=UPI000512BF35|nr:hypothetical protein [Lactobacillus sp. wkB10]KGG55167.1 hypothetical protein LACWKB10_0250 [Lactobacillus sp. wkB10]